MPRTERPIIRRNRATARTRNTAQAGPALWRRSRLPALLLFVFLAGSLTPQPLLAQQAAPSATAPQPPDNPHRGGTLRLVASTSGGTLDPQINYTGEYINLFVNVYDGLVSFRKATGQAGTEIVPDLAQDIPTSPDGGLTYTFTLRPDIRFSNGQPVTVSDVVASFRRIFRVGSPTAGAFYGAIAGADDCLRAPATCTLAQGLVADPANRTVTFHLVRPDTEFMHKLAFTHAVILPADSPDHDTGNTPLPGTGPYKLDTYDPNTRLDLSRNPYFHVWNPDAQPEGLPDRITYTFGIPDEAAVTAVENGQYDWMADPVPLDRLGELGSRYTAQTHVMRHPAFYDLVMNMHEAPFTSLKARQAVNYALNRKALVILFGGPGIARPLCDMVPSSLELAGSQCFYTKGASPTQPAEQWHAPDLETARRLVRESGTLGQKVTLITGNTSTEMAMGNWARDMLDAIGYHAVLRPLNTGLAFSYIQNTDNHMQIALTSWAADYLSPSNFLDALLGCENFHPHSDSSINMPGFCDASVQSLMDRAKTDTSLTTAQRNALWQQANMRVMALSPIAPAFETDAVILTSPRVKNFFYTPVNRLLFSQVWLH
ncbi:MAG: ABC transporter substrate-binding protein [Acetobacter sp.]|uniref:ABC transporter substrate-binding protein n=1 Tax=Acetobacter sp. TaxID=440 RepID=UPI0039E996D4